jgi:hypothetical protein
LYQTGYETKYRKQTSLPLAAQGAVFGKYIDRSATAISRLQLVNCAIGLLCSSSTFASASFDVYSSGAIY